MTQLAKSGPTTEIRFGEDTLVVSHLSLSDLAELRRQHVVRFLETVGAYKDLLNHEGETQRSYGALAVILEMSDAIGHLISLCCEGLSPEIAGQLPIGLQLRALIEITKLSAAGEPFGGYSAQITDLLSSIKIVRPEEIN